MLAPRSSFDPRLDRCLWQWLMIGVLACVLLPSARAYHPTFGWLWYWLLAAPAIALLALRTQRALAVHGNTPQWRRPRIDPTHMRIARSAVWSQGGISSRAPVRIASRIALQGRSS